MTSWPRSAYVAIAILIAVFVATAYFLYVDTRAAFRAVGFNDGRIYQREQTIAEIKRVASPVDCKLLQLTKQPTEFLTAKAESLYVGVASDGAVRFCYVP